MLEWVKLVSSRTQNSIEQPFSPRLCSISSSRHTRGVRLAQERKKYDEILVEAKAELNSFMATPPTGDSDEHQPTMDVLVNLVREAQIALDHVDKKIALAMTNGEEANFVPFNAMVPDNSRSFTSWFS